MRTALLFGAVVLFIIRALTLFTVRLIILLVKGVVLRIAVNGVQKDVIYQLQHRSDVFGLLIDLVIVVTDFLLPLFLVGGDSFTENDILFPAQNLSDEIRHFMGLYRGYKHRQFLSEIEIGPERELNLSVITIHFRFECL